MKKINSCAFLEYRGDIDMWWCTWKYGECGRLTPCSKPPKMEAYIAERSD